ncbi:hypothetical protein L9F63_016171 [Diploptera punctata]|uniref:GH18 domain-containing protein n=1 Tax=Diploptera punctata TaxID=6984 RepID=A0AAD8EHI5_DIPPU|nr:hypothetical protein L9F63_016171 [Diploptera punctata]
MWRLFVNRRHVASENAVICYWGSWSTYRWSIALFEVSNIDGSLCTHVVYTYAGLQNGVVTSLDPYNDLEESYGKGNYKKFTSYAESNGFKPLLGIGGWNEGSAKYSEMASYAAGREDFADSVVAFLQEYGFDGISLDWMYPTQNGGAQEDKDNYILLLQTLQEKFSDYGYTLAVAVGASPVLTKSYDVANIGEYVDYITLLSYDYHTYTDMKTDVASPLYSNDSYSVDFTVEQWTNLGAPAEKLIMGVASYGRTDHLSNSNNNGLGASVSGAGTAGQFTQEPGLLSYLEYCSSSNWEVVHSDDPLYTYAYKGNQWISYDDEAVLEAKAQYVLDKGLAGIMMYSLESDDFGGNCDTAYPLLTAINKGLGRISK